MLSDIKNVSLEENEFHRDKKSNGENDSLEGNESHVIPTRNGTINIFSSCKIFLKKDILLLNVTKSIQFTFLFLAVLFIFFFSRTTGPISTNLGTKHPWIKEI